MQKWKLCVIVLCMLAAGLCYSCSRKDEYIEIVETISSQETKSDGSRPEETAANKEDSIIVHICGEVVDPGVYTVAAGSRIYQVVEIAGGFTELAAKEYLNMAETVSDGQKLIVPDSSQVEEPLGQLEQLSGSEQSGLVNINTATEQQLMTLPGIGQSRAADIIRYREEQGKFKQVEDIMNVSGIKQAAFNKMKDKITV